MSLSLDSLNASMVALGPGALALRDDRIDRRWMVSIAPFALLRVPVTQALYAQVMGHNPSAHPGAEHPVDSVSWLDAARFCNVLSGCSGLPEVYRFSADGLDAVEIGGPGYRLPSEAEWEFACRAGSRDVRYGELTDIAWYEGNSNGGSKPVAALHPNGWGLYDMLGNVWEWCSDVYDPAVYGTYRVFRGGGWADRERGCLATNRRRSHPTFAIDDLGFRIARSVS